MNGEKTKLKITYVIKKASCGLDCGDKWHFGVKKETKSKLFQNNNGTK